MANTDAYQEAVNKLMGYLDQTVNFAQGQLPEMCKEIISYGAFSTWFWIYFWAVFAVISFLMFLGLVICKDSESSGASAVFFIICLSVSCFGGHEYMKIKEIELAPKLYVMEYLRSELESNK